MSAAAPRNDSWTFAQRVHAGSTMRSVGPLLRGGRSQLQRRGFWSGAKSVQTQAAEAPAMDSSMELMSVAETERLLFDGIRAIGYNDADATVMRDAMMWAQLRDNNQGIINEKA